MAVNRRRLWRRGRSLESACPEPVLLHTSSHPPTSSARSRIPCKPKCPAGGLVRDHLLVNALPIVAHAQPQLPRVELITNRGERPDKVIFFVEQSQALHAAEAKGRLETALQQAVRATTDARNAVVDNAASQRTWPRLYA